VSDIEVVRRVYQAFLRDDADAALSHFDRDVEWREPPHSPGSAVYRGHSGVVDSITAWARAWDEYRLELDELVEVGHGVLARCRQKVRGKASGIEVEQELFAAWTLKDGKVACMRMYHDEAEALADLGA